MFLIGIAGGSGSGKTTLVHKVKERVHDRRLSVMHLDSYYHDNGHLSDEERKRTNFDHPDALAFDLLYQHLLELQKGNSVAMPTYDFVHSARLHETIHIPASSVVIVEGILLFCDERVRDLCSLKIFVDVDPDDRVLRILKRDIEERGRTWQEVVRRYANVKEMHRQFVAPAKRYADVVVQQGGENQAAIDWLADSIRQRIQDEV